MYCNSLMCIQFRIYYWKKNLVFYLVSRILSAFSKRAFCSSHNIELWAELYQKVRKFWNSGHVQIIPPDFLNSVPIQNLRNFFRRQKTFLWFLTKNVDSKNCWFFHRLLSYDLPVKVPKVELEANPVRKSRAMWLSLNP